VWRTLATLINNGRRDAQELAAPSDIARAVDEEL